MSLFLQMIDVSRLTLCSFLKFNRAMRFKAKKMGYSLSQRGLSAGVLRNQRGKKLVPGTQILPFVFLLMPNFVSDSFNSSIYTSLIMLPWTYTPRRLPRTWIYYFSPGKIIASETEEEIFRILGRFLFSFLISDLRFPYLGLLKLFVNRRPMARTVRTCPFIAEYLASP